MLLFQGLGLAHPCRETDLAEKGGLQGALVHQDQACVDELTSELAALHWLSTGTSREDRLKDFSPWGESLGGEGSPLSVCPGTSLGVQGRGQRVQPDPRMAKRRSCPVPSTVCLAGCVGSCRMGEGVAAAGRGLTGQIEGWVFSLAHTPVS